MLKQSQLLTKRTQLGRLFNALLDHEVVLLEDVPEFVGGQRVGDRIKFVQNVYELRERRDSLPINTVKLKGRQSVGYSLSQMARIKWLVIRGQVMGERP